MSKPLTRHAMSPAPPTHGCGGGGGGGGSGIGGAPLQPGSSNHTSRVVALVRVWGVGDSDDSAAQPPQPATAAAPVQAHDWHAAGGAEGAGPVAAARAGVGLASFSGRRPDTTAAGAALAPPHVSAGLLTAAGERQPAATSATEMPEPDICARQAGTQQSTPVKEGLEGVDLAGRSGRGSQGGAAAEQRRGGSPGDAVPWGLLDAGAPSAAPAWALYAEPPVVLLLNPPSGGESAEGSEGGCSAAAALALRVFAPPESLHPPAAAFAGDGNTGSGGACGEGGLGGVNNSGIFVAAMLSGGLGHEVRSEEISGDIDTHSSGGAGGFAVEANCVMAVSISQLACVVPACTIRQPDPNASPSGQGELRVQLPAAELEAAWRAVGSDPWVDPAPGAAGPTAAPVEHACAASEFLPKTGLLTLHLLRMPSSAAGQQQRAAAAGPNQSTWPGEQAARRADRQALEAQGAVASPPPAASSSSPLPESPPSASTHLDLGHSDLGTAEWLGCVDVLLLAPGPSAAAQGMAAAVQAEFEGLWRHMLAEVEARRATGDAQAAAQAGAAAGSCGAAAAVTPSASAAAAAGPHCCSVAAEAYGHMRALLADVAVLTGTPVAASAAGGAAGNGGAGGTGAGGGGGLGACVSSLRSHVCHFLDVRRMGATRALVSQQAQPPFPPSSAALAPSLPPARLPHARVMPAEPAAVRSVAGPEGQRRSPAAQAAAPAPAKLHTTPMLAPWGYGVPTAEKETHSECAWEEKPAQRVDSAADAEAERCYAAWRYARIGATQGVVALAYATVMAVGLIATTLRLRRRGIGSAFPKASAGITWLASPLAGHAAAAAARYWERRRRQQGPSQDAQDHDAAAASSSRSPRVATEPGANGSGGGAGTAAARAEQVERLSLLTTGIVASLTGMLTYTCAWPELDVGQHDPGFPFSLLATRGVLAPLVAQLPPRAAAAVAVQMLAVDVVHLAVLYGGVGGEQGLGSGGGGAAGRGGGVGASVLVAAAALFAVVSMLVACGMEACLRRQFRRGSKLAGKGSAGADA